MEWKELLSPVGASGTLLIIVLTLILGYLKTQKPSAKELAEVKEAVGHLFEKIEDVIGKFSDCAIRQQGLLERMSDDQRELSQSQRRVESKLEVILNRRN